MLKLDEFKKLCKSELLNTRNILGGGIPTQKAGHGEDDFAHTDQHGIDNVVMSGRVEGGGTAEADPT